MPNSLQALQASTSTSTRPAPVPRWPEGQLLDARIEAIDENGLALVRIGGVQYRTRLPALPLIGQSVRLEVLDARHEPVRMRLAQPAPPAGSPLAALLRASLPRQQPLNETLEQLLAQQYPDSTPDPAARAALARLPDQLPRLDRLLEPAGLKAAVLAAGGQFETRLLRGETPRRDLKYQLLRLLATDEGANTSKPLLESALATIETRQAEWLQARVAGENPLLRIDLPLLGNDGQIDLLRLDIDRETNQDEPPEEAAWALRLHLDLEATGPIDVTLRLRGEHLAVDLCCERARTRDQAAGLAPRLEAALRQAGFALDRLTTRTGRASRRAGEPPAADAAPPLVDAHA